MSELLQAGTVPDTIEPTIQNDQGQSVNPDLDNSGEGGEEATPKEEPVTFDERQQAKVDDIVGGKVKSQREAERERDTALAEVVQLKAKIPKDERPVIPEVPDAFDDNFDTKLKARDEAITQAATFDANQNIVKQRETDTQQTQQRQQVQELQTRIVNYSETAIKLGMTEQELSTSGNLVAQSGINNEVAAFILSDDKGPLITDYLAKHPLELDALTRMPAMQGAVHIASVLKAKAVDARKPSQAPTPADIVDGGGSPPKGPGPKGATYE